MRTRSVYCDRLIDHRWRSAHPFRPRISRRRRVIMTGLFVICSSAIGLYLYITDGNRVRKMAETYLTAVLGGPVEVGRANLSIFEGLRLDNVSVHVDRIYGEDSIVFSAESFKIDYNPRAMLRGKLE